MTELSATRAIIDLDAYAHNLGEVRRLVGGGCRVMAVVKADAYGHGLVPVAQRAEKEGVAMLGVATVPEGIALREAGIHIPVFVMVEAPREAIAAALEHDLRLTVSTVDSALHAGEIARRLNTVARVHCKIDSGMGRQGFSLHNVVQDLVRVTHVPHVDMEAVWTHFANADRAGDTFTTHQLDLFKTLLHQLEAEGLPYGLVHAANSAAIIAQRGTHFDLVRPGLMTYGVAPLVRPGLTLRPVLRWETRVVLVRDYAPNATIGYGRTYTAGKGMRGALLPVGYGDGYRFALSNRAEVLIRGKRCPVRGSVCMDQIVVDITHVPGVSTGETAVLVGEDGGDCIRVEDLARWGETIPYEVTTCITRRVPRVYVGDG